jgi:hypothetical protein
MKFVNRIQDFKPKRSGYMVSEAYMEYNQLTYLFYVSRFVKGRLFVGVARVNGSSIECWGGIADRFCQMHIKVDIERACADVAKQIKEAGKS